MEKYTIRIVGTGTQYALDINDWFCRFNALEPYPATDLCELGKFDFFYIPGNQDCQAIIMMGLRLLALEDDIEFVCGLNDDVRLIVALANSDGSYTQSILELQGPLTVTSYNLRHILFPNEVGQGEIPSSGISA